MYVGYENSSTSLNMAVIDDEGERVAEIEIGREHEGEPPSVVERLSEHVDLEEIDQVAVAGYYWADNFAEIAPIENIGDDATVDTLGFGQVPLNKQFYDQFLESDLPVVVYPGVNSDLPSLHPYFTHYSALSGADRVADIRYAQAHLEQEGEGGEDFIVANVSSSNVASLVTDGNLRGTFHWSGLNHGWVGPDMLRRIHADDISTESVFLRSGFLYKPDTEYGDRPLPWEQEEKHIKDISEDERNLPDEEMLERVYWATLHNVYSLYPFAEHVDDASLEGIVLLGRLHRVTEPFDMGGRLTDDLSGVAPVHPSEPFSCAVGAAHIAKDVHEGESDVLGIPVTERATWGCEQEATASTE